METETDNLSSIGFYCTSDEPFSPGEQLNCEVVIPSNDIGYDSDEPRAASPCEGCSR